MPSAQSLVCPECQGTRFRLGRGKVECTNCGWKESSNPTNKFGAKKTEFNGYKYDSKYEAGVAAELELRVTCKDIKAFDKQFKVEMWAYDQNGKKAMKVSHKVDFRIHHNDGTFELLEAKGAETSDYQMRRRWLETFWLPFHLDYTYTVVKQHSRR
jgi:hypothetical protein